MDRAAALRAAGMLERKERGGEAAGPAVRSTVQQCGLLQDLIDISLSNLRGLRTKCAASNDLTQQEIRTLEVRAREAPAPGCAGPGAGPCRQRRELALFQGTGRWGGEGEGEALPFCPGAEGSEAMRKGSRKGDRPPLRKAAGPRRPVAVPSGHRQRGIPPAQRCAGARGEGRRAGPDRCGSRGQAAMSPRPFALLPPGCRPVADCAPRVAGAGRGGDRRWFRSAWLSRGAACLVPGCWTRRCFPRVSGVCFWWLLLCPSRPVSLSLARFRWSNPILLSAPLVWLTAALLSTLERCSAVQRR